MSDALGLVIATAAAMAAPEPASVHAAPTLQPAPLVNAVSLSLPAVDGFRGLGASYERWLPGRRISLAALGQVRQTAAGDYGALAVAVGGELRWYWRAHAWLSRLPAGAMVGWFIGGRVELSVSGTHDRVDDRWIGESLELGSTGLVGYRIAPWRNLEITPSFGLGVRRQIDLTGRLPGYTRNTIGIGLTLGWLF